jgi:diguanylate cyclase (GGDEF)-like protein
VGVADLPSLPQSEDTGWSGTELPVDEWGIRAQDGLAQDVLAEVEAALARPGLDPAVRVQVLYAQAIALHMLRRNLEAVPVAEELCALCHDLGLHATGLRATALLIDLLRRAGRIENAVQHLADAATVEQALHDLQDHDVQTALAAFAVALRLSGVTEEAGRVERRLAAVEPSLPRHQRVARWSNLAFEHAVTAMTAARHPPFVPDPQALQHAVDASRRAAALVDQGVYEVVGDEAAVIAALQLAVGGDPEQALAGLDGCAGLLGRGPEAVNGQLLWGAARVRALARLGRVDEAVAVGRQVLSTAVGAAENGTRRVLAYELMRVEYPDCESGRSGASVYVQLVEDRLAADVALVAALYRARVALRHGDDERRRLARAASLDPLTGLVNRRGAAASLADAAGRPVGESVALLLIDLDGFKDVNDSRGHLAGDAVLQRVAAALRTAARTEDVIARWGGDEFVVVAALDHGRAVALAERLRDVIRDGGAGGTGARVTASVGVAVRTTPIADQAWLLRADQAMYQAKRSGGDATVLG